MTATDRPPTSPRNLAEVLDRLERDASLDPGRRSDYRGGVRTVCAILGRPPDAVPATLPEVERLLREVPKAALGRADKTVANARSRLKAAILHCSGAPARRPRGEPLSPRWRGLHGRLASLRLRNGLSRLIRAASAAGIEPDRVSDAFVERIAQQVGRESRDRGALAFHRQVANCWNEASATVAGWPATKLTVPSNPSRPARLPLDAFPASFQRDVERYLDWAAGAGRLSRDGLPRHLSPGTLRLRREHLRLAACALARRLGYTRRVINLAVLVDPVNFKLVLAEYLEAGDDRGPGAFVQGLAVTLFGVARQWVRAPASQLDQLGQLKRRLGSRAPGLAEKNRRAIAPFEDPRVLADLLALPERLLARAAGGQMSHARALQKLQMAVAIQLLLVAPMQLHRLAALRLDRELCRPSGRQGPMFIVLQADAGGHQRQLEYPITGTARLVVDDYLDRCHRHIAPNPDRWLFVRSDGTPVKGAALRDGIARELRREVGIALTPGQFRHLAAALVLHERPGDIGLVRDLLGHASARTTAHLYAGMGTRGAASVYGALLERARAERKPEIASQTTRSLPRLS